MSGQCPTCGPTTVEQHPRQPAVTRCGNCKEWLTSVPPTQPPAAPESAVNALREALAAATPGPWQHFGDHLVWPSERGPAANDPIAAVNEAHEECAALIVAAVNALPALLDALDAARERLRVVEGERDALDERLSVLLCDLTGGLMSKTGYSVRTMVQAVEAEFEKHATSELVEATARAESAEAAHRALQAAVEALADQWEAGTFRSVAAESLRALLAGGEER